MGDWYKLDENRNPFEVDLLECLIKTDDNENEWRVGNDKIDSARISTVFLGLDHNYSHQGPPILFETMIFSDDKNDQYMERYYTWDQALAGHKRIVELLKNGEVLSNG